MDQPPEFQVDLPGYSLNRLHLGDVVALQSLFEKCQDYSWIVSGEEVSSTAAQEAFTHGPPGRGLEDKFLFGLRDPQGQLVAVLEGFSRYPDETTWWIGLLMIAPEQRGKGIGHVLVDGFVQYVRQQGGTAILLGVVEDNKAAYEFWQRLGFTHHDTREPRPFGKKTQVVHILRLPLVENEHPA
jgi:GNAT superfamily N-acetyltransferase